MANNEYYPEDELVQKFQKGEFGWVDFVTHHSPEWDEEYTSFCMENGYFVSEESAEEFLHSKDKQLEESMSY